jgi:PAS domain S-box-containing protein
MNSSEEKSKIFIVDDEELNLKYLKRILSDEYEITTTTNSGNSLALIKEIKPDIILLDVHMPVINGFELCKLILDDDETKNIPVIFISSLRTPEHVKIGLEVGAVDFIARPINKVETFARIKTHLTIGKLQKDLAIANSKLNSLLEKKTKELSQEKTLKEKSNEALLESENRFKTIFLSTPEAIIIVGVDSGEIIDVNPACSTLSGFSYNELIGMNQKDLLHNHDESIKENYVQTHENFDADSDVNISLNVLVSKSGEKIPVQNSSKTILMEGEHYIFAVIFNLSAQKKIENELEKAKNDAEEFSRIKGVFLANMSHELRTPLVGILGFSNILEEEIKDHALKYMAHSITTSGERLLNTLKVILDYADLENFRKNPSWGKINLNKIVDSVLESYSDYYKKRGLEIIKKYDQENDLFINADQHSITEAISQLLKNAITYTQFGGITIDLKTEKEENIEYAIISLEDTGIGISEEKLNSIFEDFRQVSEGYSRSYEGLGLGLTLVKNIIDLHSGEISVESKEDEGSQFRIKLAINTENPK